MSRAGRKRPAQEPTNGRVGQAFSHYRIVEILGAGGMGEVYRARDEKLGRDVAVKVLPGGLLDDSSARRRFQREARILSRLVHPHIATLLDFDRAVGVDLLVMELVAGPSLAEYARSSLLPEKEVLRLGSQLARGLMAAHAAGIVHRDIKPSNLKLTADGLLKILDFGVAALRTPAGRSDDLTETATRFVGSLPYVAPEQLLGQADERADLYATGMVLYELATGHRPFAGLSGVELTDAILHQPPESPRVHRADLSQGLEGLILKLLDKDSELRSQSARELLVDLERLQHAGSLPAAPGLASRRFGHPWLWIGVSLALLAGAGATLLMTRHPGARAGGATADDDTLRVTPLTFTKDPERYPTLSSDGNRLAYVSERPGGSGVYVRDVGSYAAQRVTSAGPEVCCPAWAPDGLSLAFVRMPAGGGGIFTVPVGGGPERRLRDLTPWFGTKLSFSADGRTLAFSDRLEPSGEFGIRVLALDTLETRRLTEPPDPGWSDAFATFSPDGQWIAFARIPWSGDALTHADISVVRATGGEPRLLVRDAGLVGDLGWGPDGQGVVFWSPTSPKRLLRVGLGGGPPAPYWRVNARPTQGCAEAPTKVSFVSRFSIARGRPRGVFTWGDCDSDIFELSVGGLPEERPAPRRLIASTRPDDSPNFSPDGRRIVFASARSGQPQIWTCDRDATDCAPLTSWSYHEGTPRWSPDGRTIAFDSRPSGNAQIFTIDVETRAMRRLTTGTSDDVVPSWSRDGRWVYFASNRTLHWEIFRVPAEGGPERRVTKEGGFAALESPTMPGVFYTRFDQAGLWHVPSEGGPERQVFGQPRCWGHWAVGPDALYVVTSDPGHDSFLSRLDPRTGRVARVLTLPSAPPCGESALAISPDGRFVLYSAVSEQSDLLLVDADR